MHGQVAGEVDGSAGGHMDTWEGDRWIDGCTDRHKVRPREGGVN